MNINTIKTGDLIIRQKGPLSTHYIVNIGWNNGVHVVAENQAGHGVRFTTLEKALNGSPIVRFEPFGGSESQRNLVIPKIKQLIGRKYNLIDFNCEHFARFIAHGRAVSRQVRIGSTIAIALGGLMLTSKNKAVRFAGAASVILGIVGHISQLGSR